MLVQMPGFREAYREGALGETVLGMEPQRTQRTRRGSSVDRGLVARFGNGIFGGTELGLVEPQMNTDGHRYWCQRVGRRSS